MTQDDHQGVCPDGWHLPSYREWEYLKKLDANSLLSTEAFGDGCKVGNNETGFSILPVAGSCRAIFWSASLIDFIPNIRSAREPKSLKITNNVIAYGRWVIIFIDAAKIQKKPIICNI